MSKETNEGKTRQLYDEMRLIMSGQYTTQDILGFIQQSERTSLSADQLSQYLRAVRDTATFSLDANLMPKRVVDIAGTGGDGKHTVNISTLAAILCAATDEVKVCKYGNRSASGICGSMDVLESVGISIDRSPQQLASDSKNQNFTPLFARTIYPGARHVAEARSSIGRPTLFNLLFSLARPIHGDFSFLMGFSKRESMQIASELLAHDKATCLLVHGQDGTDELSITGNGITEYALLRNGQMSSGVIDYEQIFGGKPVDIQFLQIKSKQEAIDLFLQTFDPSFSDERIEVIRQSVLVNAAGALSIASSEGSTSLEDSLLDSFQSLKDVLYSGKAREFLVSLQGEGSSVL